MRRRQSSVVKRSVHFTDGRKSSVSLEEEFWLEIKRIAAAAQTTVSHLISEVDKTREHANLSSALRLYVLRYYRDARFSDKVIA